MCSCFPRPLLRLATKSPEVDVIGLGVDEAARRGRGFFPERVYRPVAVSPVISAFGQPGSSVGGTVSRSPIQLRNTCDAHPSCRPLGSTVFKEDCSLEEQDIHGVAGG